MKNLLSALAIIVIILIAICLPVYLEIYHYKDCKRVGHTTFYCVTDIFR